MEKHHFDPERHHRRSTRLSDHDYRSHAAYYVTTCAYRRQLFFDVPELYVILQQQWDILPQRFSGILQDEFIIVPNHVHFIIWLKAVPIAAKDHRKAPRLGDVVGTYKSQTQCAWTKYIRANNLFHLPQQIWQRNYHDRILRAHELEIKRQYIRNNRVKWQMRYQQQYPNFWEPPIIPNIRND